MVSDVGTGAGRLLNRVMASEPGGTVIKMGDQVPAAVAAGLRLAQVAGAATAVQV